jgi:Zn-dependent protease
MGPMKRDQTIILVILAVVVALALSRRVITTATLVLFAVAVPSIILHEVSHGVVALWFGDDTAKRAGRITLNPIRHVDLFGTIILPAVLALSGLGVFGYAKPVPINPSRMRHPRDDAVMVSLAGPATNVVLAALAALWLRQQHAGVAVGLLLRGYLGLGTLPLRLRIPVAFGVVNVVLAVFNLLPIPPLDGSSVVERFLPKAWEHRWGQIRRYGLLVLIVLVLLRPAVLGHFFTPALNLWQRMTTCRCGPVARSPPTSDGPGAS